MECRWQIEVDPFCTKVLEKHWPHVRRYGDIRRVDPAELERVDLICGGYPCQPFSQAGKRQGEADARHLWPEFARLLRVLRPRFALLENVPGHLSLGFGTVLGDLARIRYDCEWESLSAKSFGAEHQRRRIFIIAYPHISRPQVWSPSGADEENEGIFGSRAGFAQRIAATGMECRGASRWSGDIHGIPRRVDRIKCLGNAVVPQVAEWIGERIMEAAKHE
jgi:DNA (cytosine-5)-methyltransferase 1